MVLQRWRSFFSSPFLLHLDLPFHLKVNVFSIWIIFLFSPSVDHELSVSWTRLLNQSLEYWQSLSKQECPSGVVTEDVFKSIFARFFPQGGQYACILRSILVTSSLSFSGGFQAIFDSYDSLMYHTQGITRVPDLERFSRMHWKPEGSEAVLFRIFVFDGIWRMLFL